MNARLSLLLFGAAGLLVAALLYFITAQIRGALSFVILTPEAGIVIFAILLFISLAEIVVMIFTLNRLARQLPPRLLNLLATIYVAFAGVYALFYAVLANELRGIQLLAALSFLRWLTLFAIR
ncbi:MAG TPA: hypothetical protein VFD70_06780 [Anaerolineae bacterium]|nr:hypothetical protein [Anaerolineae bacterium]